MRTIFTFAILFLSCADKFAVRQVYEHRDSLLELCEDKALLKSRGNNYLVFKTFKDGSTNEYHFDLDSGVYKLHRDTIQYFPDISSWKASKDTKQYELEVTEYVSKLDKSLKDLKINGFRTDFASLGVPLELYMDNGTMILYIPDLSKIPEHSTNYMERLKIIDENWYYVR